MQGDAEHAMCGWQNVGAVVRSKGVMFISHLIRLPAHFQARLPALATSRITTVTPSGVGFVRCLRRQPGASSA